MVSALMKAETQTFWRNVKLGNEAGDWLFMLAAEALRLSGWKGKLEEIATTAGSKSSWPCLYS